MNRPGVFRAIVIVCVLVFSVIPLLCATPADSRYILSDSVLTVREWVRNLPDYAFADREDIAEVRFEVGSKMTSIGDYAFLGCRNIRRVELPSSLTKLGEGSFRECRGLQEIKIPLGIKVLPRYLFAWCENLRSVSLPAGLEDISAHAFVYCSRLESLSLPPGLKHIGSNAFSRCLSLSEVKLPASIAELESYAFSDCENLKTAILPANGRMLGELIFSGCDNLRNLEINWKTPPEFDCKSYIFEPDDEGAYQRCVLLVPEGSERRYAEAPGWRLFKHIE